MRHFIEKVLACGLAAAVSVTPLSAQGDEPRVAGASRAARPGDHIKLSFLSQPELSSEVVVNARGEAVLPKLGLTQVTGIPILLLGDSLRTRYAQYLRSPDLEVVVLRRIVVNGEVKNPNVYYVEVTARLRDVVALAGGIIDTGKRDKVTIVRDSERIIVRDWTGPDAQTELVSGDQIVVSRRNWISINFLPLASTAAVIAGIGLSVIRY
jgi:protein involved in polysaccharide export with SLBB domain